MESEVSQKVFACHETPFSNAKLNIVCGKMSFEREEKKLKVE